MSYKRLKRIIKKLVVQQKERDEKAMRELQTNGKLTHEQLSQLKQEQLDKQAGKGAKSPSLQSFSPMLAQQRTPEQAGTLSQRMTRLGLGAPGSSPSQSAAALGGQQASPASTGGSSKGSPALLTSGIADAHAEFFSVLESDVDKVNRFFATKYEELHERFKAIETASARAAASGATLARSASQIARGGAFKEASDDDEDEHATPRSKAAKNSAKGTFSSSVAAVAAWMSSSKKRSADRAAKEAELEKSQEDYGSLHSHELSVTHSSEEEQKSQRVGLETDPLAPYVAVNSSSSRRNSGDVELGDASTYHAAPTHTISVSAQKKLDERLQALLELYRPALQLQIYSMINYVR